MYFNRLLPEVRYTRPDVGHGLYCSTNIGYRFENATKMDVSCFFVFFLERQKIQCLTGKPSCLFFTWSKFFFFFCCFRSIFLMKPPHKPVFEGKRRNYAVGRKNSRMSGGRERDTEIRGVSQSVSFAYISLVS